MTTTDDFLADLEAQLRNARPRRDPRPLVALAVLAAVAVAVLALVPRDRERPVPVTPAGKARVTVLNSTRVPGLAGEAARVLRRRGFAVTVANTAEPAARTTVSATPGSARAAARVAQAVRAPVVADPAQDGDVVVTLGRDRVPRVVVINTSGYEDGELPVAVRLRKQGFVARAPGTFGTAVFHTTIRSGRDAGPARVVRAALGLTAGTSITPSPGRAEHDALVSVGKDLVYAGALIRRLDASSCHPDDYRRWVFVCALPRGRYYVSLRPGGCYRAKPLFASSTTLNGCGARP